jgi:hypothetical protein
MTEEVLDKNREIWSHAHPKEAIWLQFVDVEHLHFKKSSSGQLTLRYEDEEFSFPYHSESDPVKEARDRFTKIALNRVDVLFIYGIGLGYDFIAAREWLNQDSSRALVFLEDDLGVIYRFFETETASEMLAHPQVQLTYIQNLEQASVVFNELFWHFQGRVFEVISSLAYQNYRSKFFEDLKHRLTYDLNTKKDLLDEYMEFGAAFFRNFYLNVQQLDRALLGNALFGKFQGVPAVICGAGPSLQKNMDVIKQINHRALIFAGSSALNALMHAGVKPHFGVGIDPNAKQAERLSELPELDFPFFYRQRLFPGALDLLKGPRLYITGTGGYDIGGWFEKRLGIKGEEIEEGRNVVNFTLELASRMGCNPIIFVGMDLGYTDMRLYSPGVITPENSVETNEIDLNTLGSDALLKKDIYGNPFYTLWKWVSEAKWISDFSKEHPEISLINATEGGLGFEGVPNETLRNVLERFLRKSYRLPSRIAKGLKEVAMPEVSKEKVLQLMHVLKEGLERCVESLNILSEENDKLRRQVEKGELNGQTQTAKATLVETELADEEAFRAVLEIFNAVYTHVLDREIKELSDPSKHLSSQEKNLSRIALNEKKYAFLKQVAQVNLKLLEFALLPLT